MNCCSSSGVRTCVMSATVVAVAGSSVGAVGVASGAAASVGAAPVGSVAVGSLALVACRVVLATGCPVTPAVLVAAAAGLVAVALCDPDVPQALTSSNG